MNEETPEEPSFPDVFVVLADAIDEWRSEHEAMYRPPADADEATLHGALDVLAEGALHALQSGQLSQEIERGLASQGPWQALQEKVNELVWYSYVQRRTAIEAASEVVDRLRSLEHRVGISTLAFLLLQRASPSETALKYLKQVSRLYLAGFPSEAILMCGALLEAAVAARFPDDGLRARGWTPKYAKTGVFSIGQRMKAESTNPIFDDAQRERFWQVVNWRNDVMHVQPDIVPAPERPLLDTAFLLGLILPAGALPAA